MVKSFITLGQAINCFILLQVHFRGYPENILTPCEGEESVKWSFINSLKEVRYNTYYSSSKQFSLGTWNVASFINWWLRLLIVTLAFSKNMNAEICRPEHTHFFSPFWEAYSVWKFYPPTDFGVLFYSQIKIWFLFPLVQLLLLKKILQFLCWLVFGLPFPGSLQWFAGSICNQWEQQKYHEYVAIWSIRTLALYIEWYVKLRKFFNFFLLSLISYEHMIN